MKTSATLSLFALLALTNGRPTNSVHKREVPQEHSHERILTSVKTSLNLNNPAGIADPVFGLLGNAAAAAGAGTIKNLDCLHQATADQAFTNAKAAKDVAGQANALLFAALERNTGKVGLKSVLCTEKAVNPEIAAITQHQDPASAGAAAGNKAIALALAKQLSAIGADPQLALDAGTFAPGKLDDATGAGNTCDDLGDAEGCIFTKKLLIPDATAEEITAAAGGAAAPAAGNGNGNAGAGGNAGGNGNTGGAGANDGANAGGNGAEAPAATAAPVAGDNKNACPAVSTVTVDAPAAAVTAAPAAGNDGAAAACPAVTTVTVDAPAAGATQAPAAAPAAGGAANGTAPTPTTGTNVQTFTGTLGGAPPAVESSAGNRPFSVNGNTFVGKGAALSRSCAIQNNACSNAVNSKTLSLPGGVGDCGKQETECNAAAKA